MNDKTRPLDLTMIALSHPIRRVILDRLMRQDLRVTELARPFRISLNAVSKHIFVLERAGLVRRRRIWREHLISVNPAPLDEALAWMEKSRTLWNARLDALDALLKAEDLTVLAKSKKKGPRT
jgi:DNA-binding transcriptional ArsR family regulator